MRRVPPETVPVPLPTIGLPEASTYTYAPPLGPGARPPPEGGNCELPHEYPWDNPYIEKARVGAIEQEQEQEQEQ